MEVSLRKHHSLAIRLSAASQTSDIFHRGSWGSATAALTPGFMPSFASRVEHLSVVL